MLFGAVDITEHLNLIFGFMNDVYACLDSIEFTAFGFHFTLFGILFGSVFLLVIVEFMRFGFLNGGRSELKYLREENKKSDYVPKHAKEK